MKIINKEILKNISKLGFTLVELIVVITILAILSTISFITLSGYSKEARDSKRISDTRNLLTKINVEQTKGRPLSELIINTRLETTKILGVSNSTINTFGKINFDSIKEDSKLFKDPSLKTQDYPVAYAIGGTGSGAYKFFEIATISEKENTTKVMGNYYKLETDDAESLFLTGGLFYKEGDVPIYNVNGGALEAPTEIPVITYSCQNPSGVLLANATISNTELLTSNTDLQNTNSEGLCYYECKVNYSGTNCITYIPPAGVNQDGDDLVVSDGVNSITIADRNLGATEIYNGIEKVEVWGNHYQWGKNVGYPSTGTVPTSTTLASSAIAPSTYLSPNFIIGNTSYKYDWVQTQNDNLWGGGNDTSNSTDMTPANMSLRQGLCPNNYHVPSKEEWNKLIKIWFKSKGETCLVTEKLDCAWINNATLTNFKNELKIPLAGGRGGNNGSLYDQGMSGYYWSSSPSVTVGFASRLYFNSGGVTPQSLNARAYGFSLRCFKN